MDGCVLKVEFKDIPLLRVVSYNVHDDIIDVFLFIFDMDNRFFLQLHFLAIGQFLPIIEKYLVLNIHVCQLIYFCSNLVHAVVSG